MLVIIGSVIAHHSPRGGAEVKTMFKSWSRWVLNAQSPWRCFKEVTGPAGTACALFSAVHVFTGCALFSAKTSKINIK